MTILRREMNIANEMHYEINASAFARDFYALDKEHDMALARTRIVLSRDGNH